MSTEEPEKECVNVDDVIQLLCDISAQKKMKAALKRFERGILVAASTLSLGLVVGFPVVGGAVGGLLGAFVMMGQFQPVALILNKLPSLEKRKLFNKVRTIIEGLEGMDSYQLTTKVKEDNNLYEALVEMLERYFTTELEARVKYDDSPLGAGVTQEVLGSWGAPHSFASTLQRTFLNLSQSEHG
ncbi:protein C19orf12 homolog [Saccopteryx bilineata]|uniref:protein C19orf12 homolog n=1 Tax=Saccopteryx bilineata TaxID=59482 RepID=UPI0033903973